MSKKIGILGSGVVGRALAGGFFKYGYEVMIGSNNAEKQKELESALKGNAKTGNFEETAGFGEILVLAVKGSAAEKALQSSGKENLAGKTIIDATNPISDEPPVNGVLKFFTDLDESLMEKLQTAFPEARFVKAFSCVGNAFMVDPDFGGQKPTMFIAGNDGNAKTDVKEILDKFGWETEDMGAAEAARAIEPLCILWCIPGFVRNQWMHAFKLLKK